MGHGEDGTGRIQSREEEGERFTAGKAPWEHGPSPRDALERSGGRTETLCPASLMGQGVQLPSGCPHGCGLDPAPPRLSLTCLSSETLSHSRSCRLERSCSSSARSWSIWGQGQGTGWFCRVLHCRVHSVRDWGHRNFFP